MRAVAADLKVEMIAGGPASGAHIGNGLALGHGISHAYRNGGAVGIQGGEAAAMIHNEIIAVAPGAILLEVFTDKDEDIRMLKNYYPQLK